MSACTRLLLGYVVVELAAVAVLVATFGFGWTILVLSGALVVGLALAGAQARRQLIRLGSGAPTLPRAVTDGAWVALGTLLVVVPGPVTTVLGLLLLLPATRTAVGPAVTALATYSLGRRTALVSAATVGAQWYAARGGAVRPSPPSDFIDGEVISVSDASEVSNIVGA
ncbi:MAG: FxsA family protein [Mycobacterium sp.]